VTDVKESGDAVKNIMQHATSSSMTGMGIMVRGGISLEGHTDLPPYPRYEPTIRFPYCS